MKAKHFGVLLCSAVSIIASGALVALELRDGDERFGVLGFIGINLCIYGTLGIAVLRVRLVQRPGVGGRRADDKVDAGRIVES